MITSIKKLALLSLAGVSLLTSQVSAAAGKEVITPYTGAEYAAISDQLLCTARFLKHLEFFLKAPARTPKDTLVYELDKILYAKIGIDLPVTRERLFADISGSYYDKLKFTLTDEQRFLVNKNRQQIFAEILNDPEMIWMVLGNGLRVDEVMQKRFALSSAQDDIIMYLITTADEQLAAQGDNP